ncbi:MAG: hypothetical protein FH751_14190 [Firmicutes bacterium]|nr:hypothetical protein [Bacillota bacterium]
MEKGYWIYFDNSNNYEYMWIFLDNKKHLNVKFHTYTNHQSKMLEKEYIITNGKIDDNFIEKVYKELKPKNNH